MARVSRKAKASKQKASIESLRRDADGQFAKGAGSTPQSGVPKAEAKRQDGMTDAARAKGLALIEKEKRLMAKSQQTSMRTRIAGSNLPWSTSHTRW